MVNVTPSMSTTLYYLCLVMCCSFVFLMSLVHHIHLPFCCFSFIYKPLSWSDIQFLMTFYVPDKVNHNYSQTRDAAGANVLPRGLIFISDDKIPLSKRWLRWHLLFDHCWPLQVSHLTVSLCVVWITWMSAFVFQLLQPTLSLHQKQSWE